MAFYRKVKQKGDNKWHPRAITIGRPYTTDEVARKLSEMSTVSPGDTYAVLVNLGQVLGSLMSSGRSVKLKGIGTFYYTCRSEGTGVETPEEVHPTQITGVQIRFIPEYARGQRGQVTERTLIDAYTEWVDIDKNQEETL
ncbi:HU family DNA-binding protein [uncultured Bacteroides sp.]|uniref:HU family DNA-binding protein n=1 Tax=uncultured Bacteroides sp. TaxID=162156 RepID=UPI002633A385|nr:HU family DNA-binding protein [uncultured Bacteroides sp.]